MNTLRRTIHPQSRVLDAAKGLSEYVASDESIDSYREVIRATGWRFNRFQKNAPFVDGHNYDSIDRVLGKVVNFGIEGNKLVETVQWAIDVPENTRAQLGWKMFSAGMLPAVSVGFIPLQMISHWDANDAGKRSTWLKQLEELGLNEENAPRCIFMEQDQVELSAVVIGANANAVARCYKSGALTDADIDTLSQLHAKQTAAAAQDADSAALALRQQREAWLRKLETAIKNS